LKLGSRFRIVREEIAKKVALACAVLWNFYMIVLYLFWINYMISFFNKNVYPKIICRETKSKCFLKQPHKNF
jgi:hypothetical protein